MENKGIIACIFDLSFNEFVTTRIIKILFMLSILLAAFAALFIIIGGFASGTAAGFLGALIMAPIVFILSVLFSRIWLELVIVAFRVAENTSRLVEQGKAAAHPRNP
jgi:hypothetical protein